ncbi:hypothetical protein [Alkalihalobacillus deserti]|uniref:hypothetical protein n=1 Tax=Alkalihalobacillus deserti TaxID=2879466 RepID=UPI001D14483E|nr:hypothetical protein [Alkalihalobacillus deserti]
MKKYINITSEQCIMEDYIFDVNIIANSAFLIFQQFLLAKDINEHGLNPVQYRIHTNQLAA